MVFTSYQKIQALDDLPHVSRIANPGSGLLQIRIEDEKLHEVPLQSGRQEHEFKEFTFVTSTDERSGDLIANNFSIPLVSSTPFSLNDFTYPREDLPRDQLRSTEKMIAEMGVISDDSSSTKVHKIASALHQKLIPARGPPSPIMRHLSGFEQYQATIDGQSKVHCANHAEIFAHFATVAGVPTRLVDVGGTFNGVPAAAHAFAESYIEEQNTWAYVDMQLNVAMVSGINGRLLNGIDVLLRSSHRNWGG